MKRDGLTPKQAAFVREYLIDLNATQAAIRAGYKPKNAKQTATENLSKPIISAAIADVLAERGKKLALNAEYVLLSLHDVEKKCRADVPVLDKRGQPTGEYRFDSAGANRALELIGKHLGMFKERVEHTGPDGGPIRVEHDLSGLTIDDLARLESILEKTKAKAT